MENEQAKKKFLTLIGIVSIMALIFIFWILNVKNIFKFNDAEVNVSQDMLQLEAIQQEFSSAFDELNKELESLPTVEELETLQDPEFLQSVVEGTNKTSPSVGATTTATITNPDLSVTNPSDSLIITPEIPAANNCPAYVNCMPTIGMARDCQIPAGCEGITQLVY